MGLVEIVADVRQVFTRDPEEVGVVEVAGGEHESPSDDALLAGATGQEALEGAVAPLRRDETRVGPESHTLHAGDPAVVLEAFLAGGLLARADQRVPADFHPLRRREERHPDRIARDRVDEHPAVQEQGIQAAALGGHGARETDRPRARDHGVFHGSQIKLRRTNQMFAGRSASLRMYQANHAVP